VQWTDALSERVQLFLEFTLDLLPGILPGPCFDSGCGARALRLLLEQHPLRTEEAQVSLDLVHPITVGKRRLLPQVHCPLSGTSMKLMPELHED
jgi:hypothetical protein